METTTLAPSFAVLKKILIIALTYYLKKSQKYLLKGQFEPLGYIVVDWSTLIVFDVVT